MSGIPWRLTLALSSFLPFASVDLAQSPSAGPHAGYVYPAGGRRGTTVQVLIGGQYLDGVSEAHVSGAGITASVMEYVKPLTQNQYNNLRDKLQELLDRRKAASRGTDPAPGESTASTTKPAWAPEDELQVVEIRKRLATYVNRPSSPAIAETVTVELTLAKDAAPGTRELRLRTPLGMTNPLVFCVGQFPEFSAKELRADPPATAALVPPAVINGQIMPGKVDRVKFQARWGQKLVISAAARELIPYLADAVPGWFQATLALYDPAGREVAYDDDFRFNPDPVLFYEVRKDGEYTLEIKDAIYRGREDFVYRITLGELPFITSAFPLGGPVGAKTTVALTGWNLPPCRLTVDALGGAPGIRQLDVHPGGRDSNRVPFALDTLPECLEQEPNDDAAAAQRLALPIVVNGRIDKPGDRDVFRFEGKAGQEVVAEVTARRLGSPLDSRIALTDASGKQIAFNDDHEDKAQGLMTHHADSWLSTRLPSDGTYYVHVADTQHNGGREFAYRLRLSGPRPDFELRVVPSAINVRAGASAPMTVYAIRRDGFAGDIDLALKGAPDGFVLGGARIPAGQDQVRVTLSVPTTATPSAKAPATQPLQINLEGRGTLGGTGVTRLAIPADDMMQAFFYRHLVPAQELLVTIVGRPGPKKAGGAKPLSATPAQIPAGGTASRRVAQAGFWPVILRRIAFNTEGRADPSNTAASGDAEGGTTSAAGFLSSADRISGH